MRTLWQDVRFGLRILSKHPGFSLIAISTLALGIGATTAIFSVVNGVLLRPLPFNEPERLVSLWESGGKVRCGRCPVSQLNFADWQKQSQSFSALTLYGNRRATLTGESETEQVGGALVTPEFFQVLGVSPLLGRNFNADEAKLGGPKAVIIGHKLWLRRFGGASDVVGKMLVMNDTPHQIIGVAPPGMNYPNTAQYWTSGGFREVERGTRMHAVLGRLKPGVSLEAAQNEMNVIANRLAQAYPEANEGWTVGMMSLHEEKVGDVRRPLWLMLGAVGFVLLIACANVASMLLARAASRQKEFAVRAALGAGRWRLMRQLLIESLPLALLGGCLGVLFASWGIDALIALSPKNLPRLDQVRIDHAVLAFAFGVSVLTGVLFGMAPAWQLSRPDLVAAMNEGAHRLWLGATGWTHRVPLRNVLVVVEIALALLLLIGAGLMTRSLRKMQSLDLGFQPDHAMTVALTLSDNRYEKDEQVAAFYDQLLATLQSQPGIEKAALGTSLPLGGAFMMNPIAVPNRPDLSPDKNLRAFVDIISPDYFATLGIPLRAGRSFNAQDRMNGQPVAIINDSLAKRFWPGQNAIGQHFNMGGDDKVLYEIVGVVGDISKFEVQPGVKLDAKFGNNLLSQIYMPMSQRSQPTAQLIVRSRNPQDSAALIATLKALIWQQDKTLPLADFRTTADIVYRSAATPRFYAVLFGAFAVVALLMALAGIYGVLSFTVAQRTREIGIRLALGAQASNVVRLFIRQGLVLASFGLVTGIATAYGLTRLMSSLLYDISPTDPLTYAALAGALMLVALIACWIPARRATKIDPMIALRTE